MAKEITDEDRELLGELGVETETTQGGGLSAREQRILAGFEEIERFVREKGRQPEHGEQRDIFERLYAVRLDRIRSSPECRAVLRDRDPLGLLAWGEEETGRLKEPEDDEILASLGVAQPSDDITKLVHVRSRSEIRAAEEIAQRNACTDFERFEPIFELVRDDLKSGHREYVKYQDNAEVRIGDLFVLEGQTVMVAELGSSFISEYGRPDRRLKVVYDNGTESDLLLRSLQRALNKDAASRRIVETDAGPLFSGEVEPDDLPSGFIYVLRSKSEHPFVAANRQVLHKIGITGRDVKTRISNPTKKTTYLLSEVELVATYQLANINRRLLEALLHRFFKAARLDLELKDRFGFDVAPREWFLVPFSVIEEAIEKLKNGTISSYRYEPALAMIVPVTKV